MERVLRLFRSKFQLTEQEGLLVVISDTATERLWCSKFFLVGKVLLRKTINPNVVMGVFKDLWIPKADVEVMAIDGNRIMFCFGKKEELKCVLSNNPWYFGKTLLVLADVKGLEVPADISLLKQEFWVRVHGLPPSLMSRRMKDEGTWCGVAKICDGGL
ncbi:hypothetical protein TB2_035392 [Malus domestica]